jgi:AcrR family transcriptional regulator
VTRSIIPSDPPQARPGGRTQDVGLRVAEAVLKLLEGGGYAAVTHQAVAEAAQVGRATVYRRWPTRPLLTLFGIAQGVADRVMIADTGALRTDMTAALSQIAAFLDSPLGRAALAASMEMEVETDARHLFWTPRAQTFQALFERAIGRGEIGPGSDWEAALAMAAGALYFRILIQDQPIDADWIARIVTLGLNSLDA